MQRQFLTEAQYYPGRQFSCDSQVPEAFGLLLPDSMTVPSCQLDIAQNTGPMVQARQRGASETRGKE